jgi:transcriptional regulator with XRE-family HTH domain
VKTVEQDFIEELGSALEHKGISQSQLARELGVERQMVHQYLKGHRPLLTEFGAKMLEHLGYRIKLEPIEK